MHRRQVDDVETELGEPGQHGGDPLETAERPRKQLVPGAEAPRSRSTSTPRAAEVTSPCRTSPLAASPSSTVSDGPSEERCALRQLAVEVELTALEPPPQLVLPGGKPVGPRHDRERPAAGEVDDERPAEAIVAEIDQRLLAHLALRRLRSHRGAEDVVPVDEDRRVDVDALARGALDGEAPAVQLRLDRLDLNPRWRLR